MAKVYVCQSSDCAGKGSDKLIRDIEELCTGSKVEVVQGSCLNLCGKGPNCEIHSKSGKTKQVTGVSNWKNTEQLVRKELGVDVGKLQKQVSELKYEARRETNLDAKMAKIDAAFKALGGEAKAADKDAQLAVDLLVMRARDMAGKDPSAARKDAEQAVARLPNFAGGHSALALVQEAQEMWEEALETVKKAIDIGGGSDVKQSYQLQRRLEKKMKEIEEKKKKEEKEKAAVAEANAAEAADAAGAAEDTKAKTAGVKAKAKAKKRGAKPKSEADGGGEPKDREAEKATADKAKADAEAKAKAEEEEARAEEEARRKAEEEEEEARRRAEEEQARERERLEKERLEAEEKERLAKEARDLQEAKEIEKRARENKIRCEQQARERARDAWRVQMKAAREQAEAAKPWFGQGSGALFGGCCAQEQGRMLPACPMGQVLQPRIAADITMCDTCTAAIPAAAALFSSASGKFNVCGACYDFIYKEDEPDAARVITAE